MRLSVVGKNNPNWKGGLCNKEFTCVVCSKVFTGYHKRNAKYCSLVCKGVYQTNLVREKSKRWQGGVRTKNCQGCNKEIKWFPKKPYSTFLNQKFCSKHCSDKYGFRYKGSEHKLWKGGKAIRDMGKQKRWSKAVMERDNYTCQHCFKRGGDLHAHHKLSFTYFPNSRWFISNGITLCVKCHYKTYIFYGNQTTGKIDNRVNSVKVQNG